MTAGLRLLCACPLDRRRLRAVALWSMAESLPGLLSGYTVARATDALVARRPWDAVPWLLVLGCAIVAGAAATRQLYGVIGPLVEDLRDALLGRTIRGTIARCAASGRPGRATVTQLVEQVDQVRNLVSAVLRSLRSTVVPICTAALGLFVLDPRLGLAAVAPLLVAVLVQGALVPATVRRQRVATVAQETFGADAAAILADLPALVGIGAQGRCGRRLVAGAGSVATRDLSVVRTTSLRHGVILLGGHAPLLAVLLVAGPLLSDGTVGVGAVIGAATYVLTGLAPAVGAFASLSGGWLVELLVVLDRLALVDQHPDPPARGHSVAAAPRASGTDIALCGLAFAYRPDSRPILDGLELRVRSGGHVAVLGASGTGKSTLGRIVAGLEEPTRGSARVEGRLCYVPQESYLFAGTLRDNLLHLTQGHVGDDEIAAAARAFGLEDLIRRLGGLDTRTSRRDPRVTDADRQRVVLARAWLSAADVVILDEATSLIPAPERVALVSLHRRHRRTLVTITHDLDLATRADAVVYFDGAGTHVGSHDELLSLVPSYATLHEHGQLFPSLARA